MPLEVLKWKLKQAMEDPETLELYLYSEVAPDGYDWWNGRTIESKTSQDYFRDQLAEHGDVKQINLYINSCGGSVVEGYGIYAQLKRHPAQKTVYVDGFANSIASIIAMCGDKIIMRVNSMMGIHNMMDACFGNAAEHRRCAEDLDRMMKGNRQIYLARSGGKITLEKLTELLDAETMLTAEECLAYGFCDVVEGTVSDPEQMTQMMQRINVGLAAQMRYHQSLRQAWREALEPDAPPPTGQGPKEPPQGKKLQRFFNALK